MSVETNPSNQIAYRILKPDELAQKAHDRAANESDQEDRVAQADLSWKRMAPAWDLVRALMGGTRTMRAGGERWLPKFAAEDVEDWRARIKSSYLYGAYSDAVKKIVSKPFSKPIQVDPDPTGRIAELMRDVDNCGRSLHDFARRLFRAGVAVGSSYFLVEYPRNDERQGNPNLRPYFAFYRAEFVIGRRYERNPVTGEKRLVQARLQEVESRPDPENPYAEEAISTILVWNAPPVDEAGNPIEGEGTIERWEFASSSGRHELVETVTHDFPGIPLVRFAPGEIDEDVAFPPLEDLAWLNLEHYQSSSDQRSILHFARAYQAFAAGVSEEEFEKMGQMGVNRLWHSQNQDATVSVVEHSGAAIEAGERDLASIEEKMEGLGEVPFVQRSGNKTATEKAIDEGKSQTEAQSWVGLLEEALRQGFEYAATWLDEELPSDFAVEVFSDFGFTARREKDLEYLDKARVSGDLSRETWLGEAKSRQLLSEDLDVEEELVRLENQDSSSLEALGNFVPGDPAADDPDAEV